MMMMVVVAMMTATMMSLMTPTTTKRLILIFFCVRGHATAKQSRAPPVAERYSQEPDGKEQKKLNRTTPKK